MIGINITAPTSMKPRLDAGEAACSAEFVAFLADIVANQPRGKEIHVIADNLSAHKTKAVAAFLADHPKVPTRSRHAASELHRQ